jgi:hypothetical protein
VLDPPWSQVLLLGPLAAAAVTAMLRHRTAQTRAEAAPAAGVSSKYKVV